MSDNVTLFRPNSPMGEAAKALEAVIRIMRKHDMGSLLCEMGGFSVSIKSVEQQTSNDGR